MKGLSRDIDDKLDETLGDRITPEQFQQARKEAENMIEEDEATAAFNAQWGDMLKESEVEGMKDYIRQLRRRQPLPQDILDENEEYAMAVVVLLKLGMLRAADFLKSCTTTPEGFEWKEIQDALDRL